MPMIQHLMDQHSDLLTELMQAKPLVVVVGRLSRDLKLEGLLSACDAIGAMAASGIGVQLAIVGDGDAKDQVAERAKRANAVAGRRAVVLTGSLTDPRPAYAAGDVLLGMGSSALRAMSFGKPLIVQGQRAGLLAGVFPILRRAVSIRRMVWFG